MTGATLRKITTFPILSQKLESWISGYGLVIGNQSQVKHFFGGGAHDLKHGGDRLHGSDRYYT